MSELNCEKRVDEEMKGRLSDVHKLQTGYASDEIDREYSFNAEYVAPNTFDDQPEGYFRYQMSWGGPSDEFRFFVNPDLSCHRIEYWFLDWIDGAHRDCSDDEVAVMLWEWLKPETATIPA